MAAFKRTANGEKKPTMASQAQSPFMSMFETFRNELDEHHDRRERIIKASRDITAQSKKMIFSLQRARTLPAPIHPSILKENSPRQQQITSLFASILPDLQSTNAWRYQRQISPGVQEYMEAVSFQHYLETQRLITHAEAQTKVPAGIPLTEDDYVLGIFDLVGELMRFAITSMATNGFLPGTSSSSSSKDTDGDTAMDQDKDDEKRDMAMDLRSLRSYFESLDVSGSTLSREAGKKIEVMQQCVEKVENAVYGMIVRGRERPKGWVPDLREEQQKGGGGEMVESY